MSRGATERMSNEGLLAQSIKKRAASLVEDFPLHALADEINTAFNKATTVQSAIRAGRYLLLAKSKLPHSEFGAWLAANCKVDDCQARGYMLLALNAGFELRRYRWRVVAS
jgi:hypothetical protein